MRTIALIAVTTFLLLVLSSAMSQSSVGGPLNIMLILLLAMLAVGISEAWSMKRGAPGWIVNIVVSVVAGFLAASVFGVTMESILPSLNLEGSLASSGGPLIYVTLAAMTAIVVLGSRGALGIVNRFR